MTEPEIEKLRKAARKNRNPVRDELLILLAFRHALRVSELVGLTVEQFDLKAATYTSGGPRTARHPRAARRRAALDPAAHPRKWRAQPLSVALDQAGVHTSPHHQASTRRSAIPTNMEDCHGAYDEFQGCVRYSGCSARRERFQGIFDFISPQTVFGRVALLGDAAFLARPHPGAGTTKCAMDAECFHNPQDGVLSGRVRGPTRRSWFPAVWPRHPWHEGREFGPALIRR